MLIRIFQPLSKQKNQYHQGPLLQPEPNGFSDYIEYTMNKFDWTIILIIHGILCYNQNYLREATQKIFIFFNKSCLPCVANFKVWFGMWNQRKHN